MAEIVPLAEAVCFVGIGLPSRAANLTTGGGGCHVRRHRPRRLEPGNDGELTLTELHPGVTVDEALEATGWDLCVDRELRGGDPPNAYELEALRALKPANGDTVS